MRPEILAFPVDDSVFRADVARGLDALAEAGDDNRYPSPDDLAALLRHSYRNVTISVRGDLGSLGALGPVWYVFRDRRVRVGDARRDRLYGALATARSAVADSARILDRSRAATRAPHAKETKTKQDRVRRPPPGG